MKTTLQIDPVKVFFIFTLICLGFIPQNLNAMSQSRGFSDVISCYEGPDDENETTVVNLRAFDHL